MINIPLSVLIPTYKRARFIGFVLEALQRQSYSSFEVLILLKPSGDGTEEILRGYEKKLNMRIILQNEGYVTDALNLGLKQARGDIIVFLDDDAVPNSDWLQQYANAYSDGVGGVAGDVIPAILKEGKVYAKNGSSEIIPYNREFLKSISHTLWSCPLEGLENHLVYISKAGRVTYNPDLSKNVYKQTTKSLLGMGANMSVLHKAVKDFCFPNSWILGLAWEQYLGWYIQKQSYTLLFNPYATVNHITHEQTLSRDETNLNKQTLRNIEGNLLFYRLYGLEPNISKMHRIVWLIYSLIDDIKKICWNHEFERFAHIRGMLYSEIIGLKWVLSIKVGGKYTPMSDLGKLFEKAKT
jgi:glycosyltransferase involved in cell wall biosynthesis